MTRILLTGSTGFVGKNVLPVLKQDFDVRTVPPEIDLRTQTMTCDLLKHVRPDVVVHLAGNVGGIGANKENPGRFMYDNLIMGTNLIHQAMFQGIRKFVMVGTVCAYPKLTPTPFKEESLWDGYPEETNAPYGIAKKTLMKLLETYHEQYGLNGVNLVPVNMYGPHDHFNLTSSHVIPALILKIDNAIKSGARSVDVWGTGNASREFLYAGDFAKAIQAAVITDVSPEPINIGTGSEITISALVRKIAETMGYDGEIKFQPQFPDGQPKRRLDTSRAADRLGFVATTPLDDGLKQTIQWFKDTQ